MAITHFLLLQSNFNSTQQTIWHNILTLKRNYCIIKTSPKLNNIKCFIMNPKPTGEKSFVKNSKHSKKVATNKNGVIWRTTENVVKALQVSVIAGALLFLYDHHQPPLALAASKSSSSSDDEVYTSTQTGSAAHVEPSKGPKHGLLLIFPVALVSYFIIKRLDDKFQSQDRSVLKLQVGLLGTSSTSLRSDLKQIVATSTSKGLSYVLQVATLALLRHRDYCISGYSSVDLKRRCGEGERRFNRLSIEERAKFDEGTLVNVNDIRKESVTSQSSSNEYIVVTILVYAWYDEWKLPPVTSSQQLKQALQNLASIPSDRIIKVEVLWNPQHENDFLSEQELLEDYPLLHPI